MASCSTIATPEEMGDEADRLIDEGRIEAARLLIAAAKAAGLRDQKIQLLLARICVCRDDLEQAVDHLSAAVSLSPAESSVLRLRAGVWEALGNFEAAARDAAASVILDSSDPAAKAALGRSMVKLGRRSEGIACLAEAVERSPRNADYRRVLAYALEDASDLDAAMGVLEAGIAANPSHIGIRNEAILLCMRQKKYSKVADMTEQARVVGIVDATTLGIAGHAWTSLGEHRKAHDAYCEALKLSPEDPQLRHLVSISEGATRGTRPSDKAVRAMFDGYASRFEEHVLSLGYSVPALIRSLLLTHPKALAQQPVGAALDLGCGTGLVGLAIGDLPIGPLTGVDLAPRMLAEARAKGLYAELREGDIVQELKVSGQTWPLIIAADVFCYFEGLDDIFSAIYHSLEAGGWFVFSVERLLTDFGRLSETQSSPVRHGRYAHAEHYVYEQLFAAGFRILQHVRLAVRREAGADVPGLLIVAER